MKIKVILGSPNPKGKTAHFMRNFFVETKRQGIGITNSLIEADGLFIFTPVHWFSVPWKLKKFIDTELHKLESQNYALEGKLFGTFVFSPQGGESLVLSQLAIATNLMGFVIPPYSLIYFRNKTDLWATNFHYLLKTWKKYISTQ